ncbi:DUF1990 domain-containing protein [Aeromicrobium phragmitis]|uniref:DUF1990 domain-containing protein n=1 Tax=Aeromicrobium phragmitis TaxID=2478914 RepID=A0A3L8PPN6_9ACTN|nr:DUF1990 domain-containing protein [Aeromicrobium phragmitis]RLV55982.1 DUF1990 domain-containing protein [Aeromicrobium phragmitis]
MRSARHDLHKLHGEPFSYELVGATRGALPAGFAHVDRSRLVGHGERDFHAATAAVLRWQAQRGVGVRVVASTDTARIDSVLVLRLGLGPAAITAPARVVYVLDDERRRGFAYGTLPGHPLSGEESFLAQLCDDGAVVCTVRAFSRPAARFTRLAGPLLPVVQNVMAERYLRALERAVKRSTEAS